MWISLQHPALRSNPSRDEVTHFAAKQPISLRSNLSRDEVTYLVPQAPISWRSHPFPK
jgi:hypothetical protein